MFKAGLAHALKRVREIQRQTQEGHRCLDYESEDAKRDQMPKENTDVLDVKDEDIQNDIQATANLQSLTSEYSRSNNSSDTPIRLQPLTESDFEFLKGKQLVVAPMVKASDLPFRLLCRRAGATVCYTPMLYADLFAQSSLYRCEVFQTCPEDRPLVVQICGHDPATLIKTAKLLEPFCDALDLNFGCPLREGRRMGFGAWMLDSETQRSLVLKAIQKLSTNTTLPIFCKIRLLPDPDSTIAFCQQLEHAGCSQITIHARQRGQPSQRRFGPAFLSYVKAIRQSVKIPIFANGCIRSWENVMRNLKYTGAHGVMSAEAVLANPALFLPAVKLQRNSWYESWPKRGSLNSQQNSGDGNIKRKEEDTTRAVTSNTSHMLEQKSDIKLTCDSNLEGSKACHCCGVNFYELEADVVYDPGNIEERKKRFPQLSISDEDVIMDSLTTEQENQRKLEQLRWIKLRTKREADRKQCSNGNEGSGFELDRIERPIQSTLAEERTDEDRYNWIVPRTVDPILLAEEYIGLVEAVQNSISYKAMLKSSSENLTSFTGHEMGYLDNCATDDGTFRSESQRLRALLFDVQVGVATELVGGSIDRDGDHIDLGELGKNIPPTIWIRNHIRHMCDRELFKYQLRDQIEESKTIEELKQTLFLLRMRRDRGDYKFDRAAHIEFLTNQREIMKRRREQDKKYLKNARKRIKGSVKSHTK